MKRLMKVIIAGGFLSIANFQMANAQPEAEQSKDTSGISNVQDESVKQKEKPVSENSTVTIVKDEQEAQKTSANTRYQRTEVIRYYSGRQDGNNVIKKVEVPLPESSTTPNKEEYQPH